MSRYASVCSRDDEALTARLKAFTHRYPRYGYLLLHQLLKNEGLVVNRKRTYRVYLKMGLQVRAQRRKKLRRPRVPMPVPTRPNERWSVDFMSDQLANGRRFRILNVIDDFSRQHCRPVRPGSSPLDGRPSHARLTSTFSRRTAKAAPAPHSFL